MKIIAMYLPQFYKTKENDLWWGDGYTDWTAVKGAEPLCDGHIQPRVPLDNNYYNLLDKETMQWQADLMKKYGIDGICMYHYWFKECKRVLDQPEKNLLEWQEIDMPYCFSWANEKWARSWAKIPSSNSWAKKYEQEIGDLNSEDNVLLEQDYGDEKIWEEHFFYLLPFFKDKRYIKIDNKPIFIFYLTYDIECLEKMVNVWRNLAQENGLPGLYLIGCDPLEWQIEYLDSILLSEPNEATKKLSAVQLNGIRKKLSYDQLWSQILLDSFQRQKKTYYQGISGLDETPRQGEGAYMTEYAAPDKFMFYLNELMKKSFSVDNELLFLNAWNEWGEGMYLEPDEFYKYGYLEAVREAKSNFDEEYISEKKDIKIAEIYNKTQTLFFRTNSNLRVLDNWLFLAQRGVSIGDLLKKDGFSHLAIYGMGVVGEHLYRELKNKKLNVDYIIDKRKDQMDLDTRIYNIDDELPNTEAVIITVMSDVLNISMQLKKRGFKTIIINELLNKYAKM